ncbi:hypothetical protein DTL70_32185 [Streptomyces diacarni]|uniref:Uncharacterized protein n=2 Tax=Streptomyces diacarni TaxID=2800381 RepID=A0A367EAM9_9ACTN|nr:hypothetical protein DTL70_32185 [Streptomyces diacarni]
MRMPTVVSAAGAAAALALALGTAGAVVADVPGAHPGGASAGSVSDNDTTSVTEGSFGGPLGALAADAVSRHSGPWTDSSPGGQRAAR